MNNSERQTVKNFNNSALANLPMVHSKVIAISAHQYGSKEFYEVRTNIPDLSFYVSYRTVVGFYYLGESFVTEKRYSLTTSKQLALCVSLPIRLNHEDFTDRLYEFMGMSPDSQK